MHEMFDNWLTYSKDLPANFPIAPAYTPRSTNMTMSDLPKGLKGARELYTLALLQARVKRYIWALPRNPPGWEPEFDEFAKKVATDTALAPLYERFHLNHEAVFENGPSLFIYGSQQRIMGMVNGGGLYVSQGVDHRQPKGVYATFIPPYSDDVSQGILSQFFLPMTSELGHSALDVSHFVMLAPTTQWISSGYLRYRHPKAGFKNVDYWVMMSDADVGSIVHYDIAAYGESGIPMSIGDNDVIAFTPKDRIVMSSLILSANEEATTPDCSTNRT